MSFLNRQTCDRPIDLHMYDIDNHVYINNYYSNRLNEFVKDINRYCIAFISTRRGIDINKLQDMSILDLTYLRT